MLLAQVAHTNSVAQASLHLPAASNTTYLKTSPRERRSEEFLAFASHELKTPLTSLQLQIQRLLKQAQSPGALSPEELYRRLELLDRHTKRLGRLINDLVEASSISADDLELNKSQTDLVRVVMDVLGTFGDELEKTSSRVTFEAPTAAVGLWDRTRLEQMVASLLSNAVKYGLGNPINLTIDADDASVRITVRDRGSGIAVEDRSRIFDLFERRHCEKAQPGLGLGLFLVERIVGAHAGTMLLESSPFNGTCFSIELPRNV